MAISIINSLLLGTILLKEFAKRKGRCCGVLGVFARPHGSNGSISMTIAVMSIEQGSIVTSPIEKSAD
jgi:hypothetical protein